MYNYVCKFSIFRNQRLRQAGKQNKLQQQKKHRRRKTVHQHQQKNRQLREGKNRQRSQLKVLSNQKDSFTDYCTDLEYLDLAEVCQIVTCVYKKSCFHNVMARNSSIYYLNCKLNELVLSSDLWFELIL